MLAFTWFHISQDLAASTVVLFITSNLANLIVHKRLWHNTKRNVTMISQNSFRKAWENRKLVGGALKAAHVRPDYHLYEDLFQEGSLADIE